MVQQGWVARRHPASSQRHLQSPRDLKPRGLNIFCIIIFTSAPFSALSTSGTTHTSSSNMCGYKNANKHVCLHVNPSFWGNLKGMIWNNNMKKIHNSNMQIAKDWHRFLSRRFAHLTQKLSGMELCKKKNWFTMTYCECKYMIPRGIANFAKTMLYDLGRWFANNWSGIKIQSNIWQFSNRSLK